MTDTAIEQRDEQVAEAITGGRSLRVVRKEFGLTLAELDAALERVWPIDTAARLRMIRAGGGKLDRLIEVFYTKAIAGDVNSGVLAVKALERKAELFGLDAVQRIDLQIVRPPDAPTSYQRITDVLLALKHGNGRPNGDDAAPSVAPDDPAEPK